MKIAASLACLALVAGWFTVAKPISRADAATPVDELIGPAQQHVPPSVNTEIPSVMRQPGTLGARKPLRTAIQPSERTVLPPVDKPAPLTDVQAKPLTPDEKSADPGEPPTPIAAASFRGAQPGATTAAELIAAWGQPEKKTDGDGESLYRFAMPPFKTVDVTIRRDRVATIVVRLDKPLAADELAPQLGLQDVRPTPVLDDGGKPLGQAYPERGVTFSNDADGRRISHLLLEPIDANLFVIRAEGELLTHDTRAMADLDQALQLDPKLHRAVALKARLLLEQGRQDDAATCLAAVLKTDDLGGETYSTSIEYRLLWAEILLAQGSYTQAADEARGVLTADELSPLEKGIAERLIGDALAATGQYKQAIERHQAAIALVEPLSHDLRPSIRRASRMLLIQANLGAATDIAWGQWQQKEKFVAKWLSRADEYAKELIDDEGGDPAVKLLVCRQALVASAAMRGKYDGEPWAKQAITAGRKLIDEAQDPGRKARLQWELGAALVEAIMADHDGGRREFAQQNAAHTAKYLEPGAVQRQPGPYTSWTLARLHYRTGAVAAMQQREHSAALKAYRLSLEQLDVCRSLLGPAELGRAGEIYVSIGISYWESGEQQRGLTLTEQGGKWLSAAFEKHLADEANLTIAYGNLSTMHSRLGNKDQAQQYARLAKTRLNAAMR